MRHAARTKPKREEKIVIQTASAVETCHALGLERIKLASSCKTPQDWKERWVEPKHPFPFKLGPCWTHCVEYHVKDFPAEVGFFLDVMGFPTNALGGEYAMFTSPEHGFYFSVTPASEENPLTPPETIRLEFMVEDILEVGKKLEARGLKFENPPAPHGGPNSGLYQGTLRTPNGVALRLWGVVKNQDATQ
ncbi:MAG: VOC family protein [Planctomycetota bacterium]|nr:VOC family protein [Planctomycetota bacterium]